jgi:phospholipid transport system substrate-binding protein
MRRNIFIMLFLLLPFYLFSQEAGETVKLDPAAALKYLEAKEQVLEKWAKVKPKKGTPEFRNKDDAIKKTVDELIDAKFIARYIIDDIWEKTPEPKREELFDKIKELFTELYLEDTFYNQAYEKKYIEKGVRKKYIRGVPENVYITSEVQVMQKGRPVIYELLYHMHLVDGVYKVFDIELDTVSIIRNYREQFRKNLKDQTVDELIKKIDKVIQEKRKKNGKAKQPVKTPDKKPAGK